MATRKQKHARGLAKREAYMSAWREEGLLAQAADRKRREQEAAIAKEKAERADQKAKAKAAQKRVADASRKQEPPSREDVLTMGLFLDFALEGRRPSHDISTTVASA